MRTRGSRVPNIELECMPVGTKKWTDIDAEWVTEELQAITANFRNDKLQRVHKYAPHACYWEQLELGRWVLASTMTIRRKQ